MTERFTVDSDGKWWDKIKHEYVTLDSLFRTVEELDNQLDIKQNTINEMIKTIRIYDDGYIDLNKKYKKLNDENEQLKSENKRLTDKLNKIAVELVDECISQGKATEISEMSYREFLDYRAKNGKPMELQL